MKEAIRFLQVEFNGMAPGTLMVSAEPTTAHLQARAMVGTPEPGTYHRALGDNEVHWVPSFKGILGDHHPLDPRNTAPAYITEVHIGEDTLPGGKVVKWSVDRTHWPECRLVICVNPQCTLDERYKALLSALMEIEESPDVIIPTHILYEEVKAVLMEQSRNHGLYIQDRSIESAKDLMEYITQK